MAGLTPPRPLAAEDDRSAFDCGRESLNLWFRRRAGDNQLSGVSRTSVVCDPVTGAIIGYVSLSAAQIERAFLPKAAQRNRPDPIPALLLGQLAVDRRYHGNGYARSLLFFALKTAVRLSDDMGCFGVITHPLDDDVRAFYSRFGFETLPFDPKRSMIVRITDLKHNGF
ncbi:GNAT family N-acetyltransferase [Azospirillum halopraeferens]|uniref:GNAT family N-acetyltransferase n=1 Tax=Azospirillum halopraeferens TaxID=34010 RepID=UPI00048EB707|nr:GNAT family N-acetyltransferase [Azospirillum halopraeferens]